MVLLTKEVNQYILAEGEEAPLRTIADKSYILKVIFYAENTRPRWDAGRNQMFNGKVVNWPLVTKVPAARSSRNRPAGTLEWKSHLTTKQLCTTLVFEKLGPAILKNWPRINQYILIQQDNATPHVTPAKFCFLWLEKKVELQNVHGDGLDWDLHFYFQPANSPDTNINDLGFFVSIQALHYQHPSANIAELIMRVL
jgi:hypothetical protein